MRMKHLILDSKVIHTDDTKIKMLQPGICQEAKFWPYHGDWLHNYVVVDFTIDRKRSGQSDSLRATPAICKQTRMQGTTACMHLEK